MREYAFDGAAAVIKLVPATRWAMPAHCHDNASSSSSSRSSARHTHTHASVHTSRLPPYLATDAVAPIVVRVGLRFTHGSSFFVSSPPAGLFVSFSTAVFTFAVRLQSAAPAAVKGAGVGPGAASCRDLASNGPPVGS